MKRVTFSRNYTLSLSRTCRCYCKYCAFATHQAHLYSPEEVEAAALADARVAAAIDGATPQRVIVVPGRMVNVVI